MHRGLTACQAGRQSAVVTNSGWPQLDLIRTSCQHCQQYLRTKRVKRKAQPFSHQKDYKSQSLQATLRATILHKDKTSQKKSSALQPPTGLQESKPSSHPESGYHNTSRLANPGVRSSCSQCKLVMTTAVQALESTCPTGSTASGMVTVIGLARSIT